MTVSERRSDSIRWTIQLVGSVVAWPVDVHGEAARGRSAQDLAADTLAARFPGATLAYVIPMTEIGFQPGYGAVFDLYVGAGNAEPVHARAIIMAAVKGDLGIVLDSLGPWYDQSGRRGHPNPAQTKTPICFSSVLTSVTWPGESQP